MPEGIPRDSFRSETSLDVFGPVGPQSGKAAEEIAAFNRRQDANGLSRARREPGGRRAPEVLAILEAKGGRLPCNLRD